MTTEHWAVNAMTGTYGVVGGDLPASGWHVVGVKALHHKVLLVAVVNFSGSEPIDGCRFYIVPVPGESHEREACQHWQSHGAKNQQAGKCLMTRTWDKYNIGGDGKTMTLEQDAEVGNEKRDRERAEVYDHNHREER